MSNTQRPNQRELADQAAEVIEDAPADELLEDFDAFWQQADRKGTRLRIMGETVTLPPALPLQFQLEAKRLQGSKDDDDVAKLLGILFGDHQLLARWRDQGMDTEQLGVLLVYAPLRCAGRDITLQGARELYAEQLAKQARGNPTKRQRR